MMIEMGKKYQTRDGRAVRILCVDGPGNLCVYGIVTTSGSDFINPMRWDIEGRFSWIGYCPENDLIPVPTKHEGWAVVYADGDYRTAVKDRFLFSTREFAQGWAKSERLFHDTACVAHVTWEE